MILFRHTRWKKFKSAWIYYHHTSYYDYAFSRKMQWGRVLMPEGKDLFKVKWDGDKPYVDWYGAWGGKKRYLAPEGTVCGVNSTWSCAYPERPLWYPDKNPFSTEETYGTGMIALGNHQLQPQVVMFPNALQNAGVHFHVWNGGNAVEEEE